MRRLAILIAALVMPSMTHAAPGGIVYDCDTAAGNFSELTLPAPSAAFEVTGNIKVNKIAKDKQWAPLARIRIGTAPSSPGDAPSSYGGFKLTALPGKAVSLKYDAVQMFSFDNSGQETPPVASSLQPTGSTQSFRLSFDGRAVTVAIGSETRSYPLTTSDPVVQVICSTGEFLITDLRIRPN